MESHVNTLGGGPIEAAPGSLCLCVKGNGLQCGKPAVNGVCSYHAKVEARRAEKQRIHDEQLAHARAIRRALADDVWRRDPAVVDAYLQQQEEQNAITHAQRVRLMRRFLNDRARLLNFVQDVVGWPPNHQGPPPKTELQAFVQDNQNVHRKVVTDRTNDHTEKLLAVTVPAEQKTLEEIQELFGKSKKVMRDVAAWYKIITCRTEADRLYKRTLDGLWALIKASPHKEDLCKRLVEELTEAVGMCCEGHLSRLCNVLVGFDDAFTTVISKGEILQQKMADIAALEVTTRTKKMRAKKVLEELAIPAAEHAAWLEAF